MKQTYSVFITESDAYVPSELGGSTKTVDAMILKGTYNTLEKAARKAKKLNCKTLILPSYEL